MIFSATVALLILSGLVASDVTVPVSHPDMIFSKFSPHFRCPHAKEWIAKGPKQAAIDHQRRLEQPMGHCIYTTAMSPLPMCLEFRGQAWTTETMTSRCQEEQDSSLVTDAPCDVSMGVFQGYCAVGGTEATPLMNLMSCSQAEMVCGFMSGTYQPDGVNCGGGEEEDAGEAAGGGFPYEDSSEPSDPVSCALAPGAIGAAHQAGYSTGYQPNCPGTPAEGSPYMWPMNWKANIESESMAFGSDEIVYHSKGTVYYRLDRNWKRNDWYYQRGVLRSIGRGPCDTPGEEEGFIASCITNSDDYTTMIHRGNKMMFITWKNGTEVGSNDPSQIEECTWTDLAVIGNVRNDWFMDDRGDSTDVQYLGNQHVYHNGKPRLVKQWRKKDFADQYFVMSILENTEDGDGIHWPMVLNVPGEGFGDDFLQEYTNHSLLLGDEDDYLFLLDEALEGIGGSCQKIEMEGQGGPSTGETEPIPSNLEVDPNSWVSNVYTFSPVWQPPMVNMIPPTDTEDDTGIAITEEGNLRALSCWNAETSSVKLTYEFTFDEEPAELPWMALGYRKTDECLMNPRDGNGDTEIILLMNDDDDELQAHHGIMPKIVRTFASPNPHSSLILDSLTTLEDKDGYSNVAVQLAGDDDEITITQSRAQDADSTVISLRLDLEMSAVPDVMHLMYAIGFTPTLGYHRIRACFDIIEFPSCPSSPTFIGVDGDNTELPLEDASPVGAGAGDAGDNGSAFLDSGESSSKTLISFWAIGIAGMISLLFC